MSLPTTPGAPTATTGSTRGGTVWTSQLVAQTEQNIARGEVVGTTPFWENDFRWRAADVIFEYTPDEVQELQRCRRDVVYFAQKYCHIKKRTGYEPIGDDLRDYQREILRAYTTQTRLVFLASRQIGKTVTTAIYLLWYLCFHYEKNVLIMTNKRETTVEVIEKIKQIYMRLPFFLKPGIKTNNQIKMVFDNGCILFGQATTKNPAIGFTIDVLYLDEFANVPANMLEPMYENLYPTIENAGPDAKLFITSTPNGMNLFYDLYSKALTGENGFHPLRVDWYDVPGRDEAWRERTIQSLNGDETKFNQQYGNQFLANDRLLLSTRHLRRMKVQSTTYVHRELPQLDDLGIAYPELTWHPSFDPFTAYHPGNCFVFAVDLAQGKERDYTVINIFKLVPRPLSALEELKSYRSDADFFALLQVGLMRSNLLAADAVAQLLLALFFDTQLFNPENCRIIFENNVEGNRLMDWFRRHEQFWDYLTIHTKHTEQAKRPRPGVQMRADNKSSLCNAFRSHYDQQRLLLTERVTFQELSSFGLTRGGKSYRSQVGHDDVAMSCILAGLIFEHADFNYLVEEAFDHLPEKYAQAIRELQGRLEQGSTGTDFMDLMRAMHQGGGAPPPVGSSRLT